MVVVTGVWGGGRAEVTLHYHETIPSVTPAGKLGSSVNTAQATHTRAAYVHPGSLPACLPLHASPLKQDTGDRGRSVTFPRPIDK